MKKIYEHQGKTYLRLGDCSQCGECCKGFVEPCPYLSPGPDYSCSIYDKRNITPPNGIINPLGCIDFPAWPGDLFHPSLQKCSFYFLEIEKVLVACPTYDGKEYCAEKWLKAVQAFDYPAFDFLWVDNSNTPDFYNRWKDKLPMVRMELPNDTGVRRTGLGMEYIRKHFLAGNYTRWLNLEADVIAPPETITTMLSYDHQKRLDWIGFGYPDRGSQEPGLVAFGCTMFSRKLAEKHNFADCPSDTTTDGWFWHSKIRFDPEMKVSEYWGILPLQHLNG